MRRGLSGIVRTARDHIKARGFKAFVSRSYQLWRSGYLFHYLKGFRKNQPETVVAPLGQADVSARQATGVETADRIFYSRFPNLNPMRFYQTPERGRRLNLVTDSISSSSLFGGVGTSLIFGSLLAEKARAELRIITRDEPPERKNFPFVLNTNGVKPHDKVTFDFFPRFRTNPIDIGENDRFLSTSWWTTKCLSNVVPKESIVYLIQEDERVFYVSGDEQLLCQRCIEDNEIMKVVNTRLLFEHIWGADKPNGSSGHVFFEPAFHKGIYFLDDTERHSEKRKLAFYARPGHPRNLYYLGLQAIDRAVSDGVVDPDQWEIIFFGTQSREVLLGGRVVPTMISGLNWIDYGRLLRGIDLGVSLMSTPHPSYPPLDIAASGGVVVTNAWGNKKGLGEYSKNIIVREPTVEDLLDGIQKGTELVEDKSRRLANYKAGKLSGSWQETLENAVEASLDRVWGRV